MTLLPTDVSYRLTVEYSNPHILNLCHNLNCNLVNRLLHKYDFKLLGFVVSRLFH